MTLSDRALERLRRIDDRPDVSGTRYELGEELGRGGMGIVFRARDRELDRDVAIKVTAWHTESDAARLGREARTLASLEHAGIVPVHDVGRLADGRVFLVMGLVRGQRLDEYAAPLTPPDRLRLFDRVCDAVAFAHAQGVVHRDLKPANILVGAFGQVQILDWGLARGSSRAAPTATWRPSRERQRPTRGSTSSRSAGFSKTSRAVVLLRSRRSSPAPWRPIRRRDTRAPQISPPTCGGSPTARRYSRTAKGRSSARRAWRASIARRSPWYSHIWPSESCCSCGAGKEIPANV